MCGKISHRFEMQLIEEMIIELWDGQSVQNVASSLGVSWEEAERLIFFGREEIEKMFPMGER